MGDAGSGVRISDVVRISDGYADFLSVGIRISYRWVPRNRVGAFILRSECVLLYARGTVAGLIFDFAGVHSPSRVF